jgi:outer membrane protein
MRKRVLNTLAGAACVLCGSANANDLLEAYRQAQTQDTTLQAAWYQRGVAVETRPQALAAFLPQLDASADLTRERLNADAASSTSTSPQTTGTPGYVFGNNSAYTLTLNQQIWSFESFHRLQEANLQVAQAEAAFRSAQQGLILRVAQAYFSVLSAADTLRTNQLQRQAYSDLLQQAQKRVQAGLSPQTDVKEAQSFYDVTAASVIDAESALQDAQHALDQLTAGHTQTLAPLREAIPLAAPQPERAEAWVDSALQDNFDLRSAELQAEAAQKDISVNRAKSWPTLGVQGQVNRDGYTNQTGTDLRSDSIGVVVNWPLLQGGTVNSLVRQARNNWQEQKALYEGDRRSVERQTYAAYRGVVSGIDKIKSGQTAVTSNQAAVEASRLGRELGTRTEFDLLNAQTNYYNALRGYYQSRYDYLTSLLTLKQLAGQLNEHDLEAVDGMLSGAASAPTSAVSGGLSADTAKLAAAK